MEQNNELEVRVIKDGVLMLVVMLNVGDTVKFTEGAYGAVMCERLPDSADDRDGESR